MLQKLFQISELMWRQANSSSCLVASLIFNMILTYFMISLVIKELIFVRVLFSQSSFKLTTDVWLFSQKMLRKRNWSYLQNRDLSFIIYSMMTESVWSSEFYVVRASIWADNWIRRSISKCYVANSWTTRLFESRRLIMQNQDDVDR